MNIIKKEAFGLTKRILSRDFSGNTGMAVKNSIFQIITNVVGKAGSLIFVYLIMMKYLSQELFGLYSLTLAMILFFSGFTDLGIGTALVKFISQKGKSSKEYIIYLAKLKTILTLSVCVLMVLLAFFFLDKVYPGKPIFLGFVAGAIYILSSNLLGFFMGVFYAENNFRTPMFKEILFQIFRITIIPLVIFLTINTEKEIAIFWIFLGLAISFVLSSIFLLPNLSKYSGKELSKKQKKEILKYILPLSVTCLSGVFFGYIDTIMLGRFVLAEFIAYYSAAFSLISSAVVLISFSAVLFPIFARIKKERLKIGLRKSIFVTALISIAAFIFTIFIIPYLVDLINFVTGRDYSNSLIILKILAFVLLTDPLIGVFSSYFYSTGQPKKVAKAVIISTIINILLNLILIYYGLKIDMISAVKGVAIATVLSRFIYLGLLGTIRDKNNLNRK